MANIKCLTTTHIIATLPLWLLDSPEDRVSGGSKMALVRWDPIRELAAMEVDRLNDMFSSFYGEGFSRGWVPPVDVYETEQHEIVIKAELPDMKREDIGVTFENNVLTLKGERKGEQELS